MKYKNIILIPPNLAYGDCLSVIGMLYFLLDYYETVFFYLGSDQTLINYYNCYFEGDPKFNKNIFLISDVDTMVNNGLFDDYHICNTMTGDWSGPNFIFYDLNNINKEHYYNDLNPLYNKLEIDHSLTLVPNKHLPSTNVEINHQFYFELVGLNNNVRMNSFDYVRNKTKEILIKKEILSRFGIGVNENYNIINDPVGVADSILQRIPNNFKTINVNYLSSCPGNLLTLLEDASTIHFVEGCNVNFFYHCQYKEIFSPKKRINFHIWARNRHWLYPNMNLDYAWKMMDRPKLDGWDFILH
jgi:hypothetical protein